MYKINGLIAVSLLSLTACGGSGGGGGGGELPAEPLIGVFKDSNVSGLSYSSGEKNDKTSLKGEFEYFEGDDVEFSIGGVNLGQGKGKAIMTPIDLVDEGSLSSPEVINKVRFLMMLDKDGDPSNGIEISESLQTASADWESVDFLAVDFPTSNVNTIINSATAQDTLAENQLIEHELPSSEDAITHLRTTLLCANSGGFIGSYDGSESGKIVLVVDPTTGGVNGSSYNPDNQVSVVVNFMTAIDYDSGLNFVSAEDSAKVFSGVLKTTEEIEGTWMNSSDEALTGAFTAERFGSESDAEYRYAAAYDGNDKGLFTFNVNANGDVSGSAYSIVTGEERALTGTVDTNKKLTATSVPVGDEITGYIDPETLVFTVGTWLNGQVSPARGGNFTGAGCLLN